MTDKILKDIRPSDRCNLTTVLGPTAGGKTLLAAHLAYHLDSAVISADSRQVYRNMDIGSGKDIDDYRINGTTVPSYLLDIIDAGQKYNLYEYQKDFFSVYQNLIRDGKMPVLCGGSGLYIEAVLRNYKLLSVPVNEPLRKELDLKSDSELERILSDLKKLHNSTDTDTRKRTIRAIEIELFQQQHPLPADKQPDISPLIIGVRYDRYNQRNRITERLQQRLKNGLTEEVRSLLEKGINPDDLIYYGLEYKYVTEYIRGLYTYDEMFQRLNTAIHQFGKRQMTWFRKMERDGHIIHWIEGEKSFEEKLEIAKLLVSRICAAD